MPVSLCQQTIRACLAMDSTARAQLSSSPSGEFLHFRNTDNSDPRPLPSGSSTPSQSVSVSSDADFERMRLQALGDPRLMAQLRQVGGEAVPNVDE